MAEVVAEGALSKREKQAAAVQGLIRSTRKGKTLWLCEPLKEDVRVQQGVRVRVRTYTAAYKRVWYRLQETTPVRFGSNGDSSGSDSSGSDSSGNSDNSGSKARFVPVHPSNPPTVELLVVDNVCLIKYAIRGADIDAAVEELYAAVTEPQCEPELGAGTAP